MSVLAPKISIVIPSLNQVGYLQQTLGSLYVQEYDNWEVIIVDGLSSDGTVKFLAEIMDPRIKWISERDTGQSNAINKGFALAAGDLIGWQNSDDFYAPNALSVLVANASDSKPKTVYHGVTKAFKESKSHVLYKAGQPFSPIDFINRGSVLHYMNQSLFFTRDLLEIGLRIREEFNYSMDAVLIWDLYFLQATFKFIPEMSAFFRFHDSQKTGANVHASFMESLILLRELSTKPELSNIVRKAAKERLRSSLFHAFYSAKRSVPDIILKGLFWDAFFSTS